MNTKHRLWLYRITLALIPLLAFYGLIANEVIPHLIALAGAVFAVTLAEKNTIKNDNKEPDSNYVGKHGDYDATELTSD